MKKILFSPVMLIGVPLIVVLLYGPLAFLFIQTYNEQSSSVSRSINRSVGAAFEAQIAVDNSTWIKNYRQGNPLYESPSSSLHWNMAIKVYVSGYEGIKRQYLDNMKKLEEFRTLQNQGEEVEDLLQEINFTNYKRGALLVKEHYISNSIKKENPEYITAMRKRSDLKGDWEYWRVEKDGRASLFGLAENNNIRVNCVNCHQGYAFIDYICHSEE